MWEKYKKKWPSLLLMLLVLGVIIGLNRANVFSGYGPEDIQAYIKGYGLWAPVAYVIILSLLPLLLFPDSVIVIAGGMVFGLAGGTLLTLIGSVIGSGIAFYIARGLGQEFVQKLIRKPQADFNQMAEKKGFWLVLMLRLIPLFPFKVVSYSAGLSKVKFKDFTLATTLGSLPGIMVYVNLGDKSTAIGSQGFYVAIALLIILFIGSYFLKKRVKI